MRRSVVLALVLFGCGGSDSPSNLLPGFNPPPPPANGVQYVMPIVHNLAPGSDNEMCTWIGDKLDHDIDIKTIQGYQTAGGHHIILYATTQPQPAGTTRPCLGTDTVTFRFAAGSGGEGTGAINTAPGNLVYRVTAGQQLVLNHHYINATSHPMDAQSALTLIWADPNTPHIPSTSLAMLDTKIQVPPGAASWDVNCTLQRDLKTWLFIPHMHQWGSHITIDMTSGGMTQRVFDVDWQAEYAFHPPEITRDPSSPFVFHTGDQVHVHCEWNNTTGSTMPFGMEMCVAFGAIIDDQGIGNLYCDAGQWSNF